MLNSMMLHEKKLDFLRNKIKNRINLQIIFPSIALKANNADFLINKKRISGLNGLQNTVETRQYMEYGTLAT